MVARLSALDRRIQPFSRLAARPGASAPGMEGMACSEKGDRGFMVACATVCCHGVEPVTALE